MIKLFEAMVNKQFKAHCSGLNVVVNIGAISVLCRIFKVHKIEDYVLQNNIENVLYKYSCYINPYVSSESTKDGKTYKT